MKKRIISIIIMLAMFTTVWPCAVIANSENELISKLQSVTSNNIVKTYYDDFDSDGKNEMFAFVGKSNSSDPDLPTTLLGDIWFVSENNIEKIKSSKDVGGIGFIIGGDSEPQYIKQNGSLRFKFCNMWGNGQMRTTICAVKESKNVIVRDFDGYLKQSDNGFVLTHSTYDCTIEKDKFNAGEYYGMARSWKDYWYYFDETSNEFKEYGGTEITQEQFLQFNGAQDILNLITEGQIYNILYRDNGIININIIKESGLYYNNDAYTCSNILIGYDDNSVWTIDNQHADASDDYRSPIYSGFYLPALNSDIAVYPEFKKNIDIKSDWAENDINDAIALDLIPEELQCEWQMPITRVDFCKLVWKLYIKIIVECDASIVEASIDFPDTIDLSDDDEVIIGTIAALGIVSGYEDGTFRPYNEITREEAAVMLARTASCFGKDSTNNHPIIFDDVSDISDWAKDSVDFVSAIGVMSGVQVSDYILDFQPKGTYTREQAMVTFYRLYNQLTRPETL